MIRSKHIEKYELEVRKGLEDLFNVAKKKMQHPGDLLVCQQNGFIDFFEKPCIGTGIDGINSMSMLNSISTRGIGDTTEDEYCFENLNIFFNGSSAFEHSIQKEKNTYLNIWENIYFLRTLTQIVNLANGFEYNWYLNLSTTTPTGKNKHIREEIIKRLTSISSIHKLVTTAYNRNIRNAVAHSQYHCIQGGIYYDNFQSDKFANLEAISFDEWEKRYCMSYFLLIGIFKTLEQIKNELYLPLSKKLLEKGIPIRIPEKNGRWKTAYIYPNKNGKTWRFSKTTK